MKTDSKIGGGASAHGYRHPLLSCISVFLECLADVADPKAKRRVRWTPQAAATAAVVMALDPDGTLEGRFQGARSCMKRDFRRRRRTGTTYNGLLKALERQKDAVLPIVKMSLRKQARQRLERIDPTGAWLLLAVDGSKEELPRTRDHEAVFGVADNGVFPQAFITAVVEVYTGLPWDWRIDVARASEKKHLMAMIAALPDDALLLADGAFVGLPIWSQLHNQGKPFLIRVGGNVRLITRLWPEWALVALTIATMLGVDALAQRHRDPRRLSPARLIRVLRTALQDTSASGPSARRTLKRTLGNSMKDGYQRRKSKPSRHRIVTRNTPQPLRQPPIVRRATIQERQEAQKHRHKIAA